MLNPTFAPKVSFASVCIVVKVPCEQNKGHKTSQMFATILKPSKICNIIQCNNAFYFSCVPMVPWPHSTRGLHHRLLSASKMQSDLLVKQDAPLVFGCNPLHILSALSLKFSSSWQTLKSRDDCPWQDFCSYSLSHNPLSCQVSFRHQTLLSAQQTNQKRERKTRVLFRLTCYRSWI